MDYSDPRLPSRYWTKVEIDPESGCWLWTAAKWKDGYGCFKYKGRMMAAHRLAYSILVEPVPGDMHVLHNCDTPACVNPECLYVGTDLDNSHDRDSRGRHGQRRKTHCPQNHEYTPENTRYWNGRRNCRECGRIRCREYYRQRQAA